MNEMVYQFLPSLNLDEYEALREAEARRQVPQEPQPPQVEVREVVQTMPNSCGARRISIST